MAVHLLHSNLTSSPTTASLLKARGLSQPLIWEVESLGKQALETQGTFTTCNLTNLPKTSFPNLNSSGSTSTPTAIAKTTLPHLATLIRPNGIIELFPLAVLAGGPMFILVDLVLAVLPVDKL